MSSYETRARYGSLTIPAKASSRDGFAGDDNIKLLGEYLKHYINKYVGALWRSIYTGDYEQLPIQRVFSDDPYEGVLTDSLPALFIYRQVFQGQTTRIGIDTSIIPSQITLVWVPSKQITEERKITQGLVNAVSRNIYSAIDRGKEVDFQVEGFEHDEGTFIYQRKLMNVYTIRVSEGKWSKIDEYIGNPGYQADTPSIQQYPCLFMNINIEELYERSITDDSDLPNDEFDYTNGLDLTVKHNGADATDSDKLKTPPALT